MAKNSDQLAGASDSDSNDGLLPGLLAEERESTRRVLWRIGSWAMAAVGAVIVAVIANQSSLGWRREQLAAADLARQAQQIHELARESQNEMRRLTSTIETLGNDRDRLSSRVSVLEQGLDSITGAIAKQNASATAAPTATASKTAPVAATAQTASVAPPTSEGPPAPQSQGPTPVAVTMPLPAPVPAPVAAAAPPPAVPAMTPGLPVTTDKPHIEVKSEPNATMTAAGPAPVPSTTLSAPSPTLVSTRSMMGPPDPAASKMIEMPKQAGKDPAAVPASTETAAPPAAKAAAAADADPAKSAVQRTEFAVDLGSANSIGGLRALWRGILKSNGELASLHPIIVVKENNTGLGMQLRLAAGPLQDAAAAAKICAALSENDRRCETTVFDGQRLAMAADEVPPGTRPPPVIRPMPIKHGSFRQQSKKKEDPPLKQESSLSSFFGGSSSSGAKH